MNAYAMTPRERRRMVLARFCESQGVSVEEVLDENKTRRVSDVRNAAYGHFYREGLTTREIGRIFGRDHKAVWRGLKRLRRKEAIKRPKWAPRPEHYETVERICRSHYVSIERLLNDKTSRDRCVSKTRRQCAFELHGMGLGYKNVAVILNRSERAIRNMVAVYMGEIS